MKKILLFLMLPALASGQVDSIFWGNINTGIAISDSDTLLAVYSEGDFIPYSGSWISTTPCVSITPHNIFARSSPCRYWEKTSDWKAENTGSAHCLHEWVMAAHGEVNDISLYLVDDLVYRPCGRDGRENFARICARCLRHETCTKTWGWDAVVPEKSEYQKLLEKIQR